MRRYKSVLVGVVVLASAAASARADTFSLNFKSAADQSALSGSGVTGFSGSATLTGTLINPGQFNITSTSNVSITDPNFASQSYTYIANPSPPTLRSAQTDLRTTMGKYSPSHHWLANMAYCGRAMSMVRTRISFPLATASTPSRISGT